MTDTPHRPEETTGLKFTMDESVATGSYVNVANIIHNPAEFVVDFGRMVPGRNDVRILSRVLMTPFQARQLLAALTQNVALYEKNFGPIRTEFDAPTPAGPAGKSPFN